MNTPAINSADSLADAATAIRAMRLAVEFALIDLGTERRGDTPILHDLVNKSRAASAVIAGIRRERGLQRAELREPLTQEPTP